MLPNSLAGTARCPQPLREGIQNSCVCGYASTKSPAAACGGSFAVTGNALVALQSGNRGAIELMATVRQRIAAGTLPRIEEIEGSRA